MIAALEDLGREAAAITAILACATAFVGIVWYRLRLYKAWDWVRKHREADLRKRREDEMQTVFDRLWLNERHALRNAILADTQSILDFAITNRIEPMVDKVRTEVHARVDEHMKQEELDSARTASALEESAKAQAALVGRFDAFTAEVDGRLRGLDQSETP